jgi:hypothetical protein
MRAVISCKPVSRLASVVGLALVASSVCLGQGINTSYLPGIDFSRYRSYQWVTTKPHPVQSVDAEIKSLIDSQLRSRGLTRTDNSPDLTVDYQVAISPKEEWSTFRYNEIETLTPTKTTVYVGTLGVEFSDAARKQVVWNGRITKAVDRDAVTGKKQKNLEKSVQRLLRDFPPKPPSK